LSAELDQEWNAAPASAPIDLLGQMVGLDGLYPE
jgi:hypothetical protein